MSVSWEGTPWKSRLMRAACTQHLTRYLGRGDDSVNAEGDDGGEESSFRAPGTPLLLQDSNA